MSSEDFISYETQVRPMIHHVVKALAPEPPQDNYQTPSTFAESASSRRKTITPNLNLLLCKFLKEIHF